MDLSNTYNYWDSDDAMKVTRIILKFRNLIIVPPTEKSRVIYKPTWERMLRDENTANPYHFMGEI
jgi:hypothetical protein